MASETIEPKEFASRFLKNGTDIAKVIELIQANYPSSDASEVVTKAKAELESAVSTPVSPASEDTPVKSAIEPAVESKSETTEKKIARLEAELEELNEDFDNVQKFATEQTDKLIKLGESPKLPNGRVRQPKNEITTIRADLISSKRIEWLWPGRIPMNKLSVLAGNPDQGKSLVSLYLIAQLTRRLPMFGEATTLDNFAEVLIMAAEDEADDTIRPRLEAAGAALSRVHILQSLVCIDGKGKTVAEREAQLDTDLQAVEAMLKDNPNIKLVVIDPISSFLGRANMNREQEVRAVLTPLKNLAARCQVAIVCVMHLNKNSDASAIHRIGGAVAFTGVARAVWLFTEDPEDKSRHLMLRVKNNIAKASGGLAYRTAVKAVSIDGYDEYYPYVEWLGETDQSASDILIAGAPKGKPPAKVEDAKEWLSRFLADGEQTAADVKKFGWKDGKHSWRTLERAKSTLGATSVKMDGHSCWVLPGTIPGKRTVNLARPPES